MKRISSATHTRNLDHDVDVSTKDYASRHAIEHAVEHVDLTVGSRSVINNSIIFAATVHTTLPIRPASQGVSFAFITLNNKITTSLSANYGVS